MSNLFEAEIFVKKIAMEIWLCPINVRRKRNAKIYRREMTFCQQNTTFGPGHVKMCFMHMRTTKAYANNKGADQPAHQHSLISTSVNSCLDSMICILALSKVSRF